MPFVLCLTDQYLFYRNIKLSIISTLKHNLENGVKRFQLGLVLLDISFENAILANLAILGLG